MASEQRRMAVVTGGANGIGAAMAVGLADTGIDVVAVDRDAGALEQLRHRAAGTAGRIEIAVADLGAPGACEGVAADCIRLLGQVDILVNNAGLGQGWIRPDNWQRPLKFWDVTPQQWDALIAVNATAPFLLSRLLAPRMVERGWGRLINVTTSLGTMLKAGFLPYGPTKAAMESQMAVMAEDLRDSGVTGNVLVPGGLTNTGFIPQEAGFTRDRMLQPEIMVPPLLWLVSPAADRFTARRIVASQWDRTLRPDEAAKGGSAPIGWGGLGGGPIVPAG